MKHEIIQKIIETGVVAVIRAKSEDEAIKLSMACLKGGISAIEITFTVPLASEVISALSKNEALKDILLGAGSVLDSETARIAILSGAKYIVSPAFDLKTAQLCNRYQVPYIPGCLTITEMIKAMEAGVDIIKLFPGSAFGPEYVKAIKGPLPHVNIMPTGGVHLDNIRQWIQCGVVAVGIGGELTSPAKTGNYEGVTKNAKAFIEAVKKTRLEQEV